MASADRPVVASAIEVGMVEDIQGMATEVVTATGIAETIEVMDAGRAIIDETMEGRVTVGTGRVRAAIVAAVRVAMLQNLRHV